ncbi:MAG TPA: caspase family protein [Gammaproteobacteria bacterium]|nr:caspase family protein [Gammaproteobacteria bacterium]
MKVAPANPRIASIVCGVFVSIALASAPDAQDAGAALEGFSPVQSLQVVDCLLPGQVRVVGGRTYLTPRRPTRTTAQDCASRGGEYLAYDRSNYTSAIGVWLPAAEEGDAEAQTVLGEIYERGPTGTPDFTSAALWYGRAAEQGYSRAQFNLGTLYEQGLGVEQDRLAALNWYRQASGLEEDSVIYRSAATQEREQLRARLGEQLEQRNRQIELLEQQIEALESELEDRADSVADAAANLASIRALLEQLQAAQRADTAALARVPARAGAPAALQSFEQRETVEYRRRDFGRFFALIIGVQEYDLLENLASPANDISEIGAVLESRYGFSVVTLADPDQLSMMRAINRLNETLEADDNLLIYFTGHGSRLRSGALETGYWLPRNAEPSPNDTLWVPNEFVSRHLGRIDARRVLIIADTLYAGLLGNEPGFVMIGNGVYSDQYIEWKMPKRARLVMSSGADRPILDARDARHSVFASALLEALSTNDQVLTAPELFLRVRQRIRVTAPAEEPPPDPELRALKDAGHEVGDFFLIPTQS